MGKALIVVDVQNDFCPGGALAVPEGDRVVEVINNLRQGFDLVVFTQDWHPADHASFAANQPGKKVYDVIRLGEADQVLWPVHCVQNTPGAAFHSRLDIRPGDPVFQKGTLTAVDSYSGFMDNDGVHDTGLGDFLREKGVTQLTVAGLATDYCVKFTVLDGLKQGFQVVVAQNGCRGVNLTPGDDRKALAEMESAGAGVI